MTSSANAVLHPWLKEQIAAILAALPQVAPPLDPEANRRLWEQWRDGLTVRFTLLSELPPLRMLLTMDNLAGHKTGEFVCWLMGQGVMPLYTPLGGSWLNMAESIQRILVRRALSGQEPEDPEQIIAWLEATGRGWNRDPTPFIWGGKRATRRQRARDRRHGVGGSGAVTRSIARATMDRYGYNRTN